MSYVGMRFKMLKDSPAQVPRPEGPSAQVIRYLGLAS